MRYALLQIQKHPLNNPDRDENDALIEIERQGRKIAEQTQSCERLGEYAWMFSLETGLHHLSNIVHLSQKAALPYRILYLDVAPEWHRYN